MGEFEDRVARLEALLFGPTRRTKMADDQERRAWLAGLYLLWVRGEIEKPDLDDPREQAIWERMEEYERVAERVADRVASKRGGAA